MSQRSQELLSPTKTETDEVVTETPQEGLISETETMNTNEEVHVRRQNRRGAEGIGEGFDSEENTIEKLRDEVKMAMVTTIASYSRLREILDLLSTKDEVAEFKKRAEMKVRDVVRVAKKGVAVEEVTEYRLVGLGRVVKSSSKN